MKSIKYVWKNDEDVLKKSASLATLNAYLIKNKTLECNDPKNNWRGKHIVDFTLLVLCIKVQILICKSCLICFLIAEIDLCMFSSIGSVNFIRWIIYTSFALTTIRELVKRRYAQLHVDLSTYILIVVTFWEQFQLSLKV